MRENAHFVWNNGERNRVGWFEFKETARRITGRELA